MLNPLVESGVTELFNALKRYSFAWLNLIGQDKWTEWTPSRTGWTDVGTPTVTGRFRAVGKEIEGQVRVVPATSVATVAGTSYIALPVAASGIAGSGTMENQTTNVAVGVCAIDTTNSRVYLPAQAATGNALGIAFRYEVM